MRASTIAVLLCGIGGFSSSSFAADGDLDPSFGSGGFTFTGETGTSFQLPPKPVVLPDGRILSCSAIASGSASGTDFFVSRFLPDGTLDPAFNFNGKVSVDFNSQDDFCNTVLVQPDGKILLIGSSGTANSDMAVARLNPDGTLDATFGAGTGRATIAFDRGGTNSDIGAHAALQADNKIVMVGWAIGAADCDFAIVRLMPDGTRDTTFGTAGRVAINFNFAGSTNNIDQADNVAIDDQGRIIVGGVADTGANSFDFAVLRLLPNGTLDANFNADGLATVGFNLGSSFADLAYRMILQRDGKILMSGGADAGTSTSNTDMAFARLLPNGSLDTSFGVAGKTTVPFDLTANSSDVATDIAVESNGSIVAVGLASTDAAGGGDAAVLRLTPSGMLDQSFGVFGKRTFNFGNATALFTGVALQGSQIIATGEAGASVSAADNVVARLSVDSIFANGFE
jgi:uncharacterized delta-60 repeat protein